ncbi:hypothetical protein HanPI659440_Chr01g0023671 [Helianthus annuus]|nr:hypothetical protein HanPI659440_Chr01g0023671 [Helianthus annuus]
MPPTLFLSLIIRIKFVCGLLTLIEINIFHDYCMEFIPTLFYPFSLYTISPKLLLTQTPLSLSLSLFGNWCRDVLLQVVKFSTHYNFEYQMNNHEGVGSVGIL